jgi:CRISPR-associated endonuclease/helicase Cas3
MLYLDWKIVKAGIVKISLTIFVRIDYEEDIMSDAARQRWQKEIDLLLENPDGLTPSYLSKELGVSRQTIHDDLDRLSFDGVSKVVGTHRYVINAREYLRPMRLSLPHVWLLYLLLWRVVRANLHQDAQFSTLLYRLATLLREEIADYLAPSSVPQEYKRDTVFADLVNAWREEKYIEIRYQPLYRKDASRLVIAPWWFEPAVWSDSLYLIGGLLTKTRGDKPITLKLERIQAVRIMNDAFQRPDPQTILDYLKMTWGIWVSEQEPVEVILRFHYRQKQRLSETHWHPDQQISEEGEWIIWRATIAEPREMLPWIRGWGADVEIIEPQSLRDEMIGEARALAKLYGISDSSRDRLRKMFGD